MIELSESNIEKVRLWVDPSCEIRLVIRVTNLSSDPYEADLLIWEDSESRAISLETHFKMIDEILEADLVVEPRTAVVVDLPRISLKVFDEKQIYPMQVQIGEEGEIVLRGYLLDHEMNLMEISEKLGVKMNDSK